MIYVAIYFLMGLLVGLKMFLTSLHNITMQDNRTFESSKEEIKNDFLLTMFIGVLIWPFCLFIITGFYVWDKFSKLLLSFCEKKFDQKKKELDNNKFVEKNLFDEP